MSGSLRINIDSKGQPADTSCDLTQSTPVIRPWFNVKYPNTDITEDQADTEHFTEGEDYDEDLYNSSDHDALGVPTTPSRLLTITSTDFGGNRQDDLVGSCAKASSYSENEDENTMEESPKYGDDNGELDFDMEGRHDFDEMDQDLRKHDNLITDHMNKLNLAAQTHFSRVIQRLLKEKNDAIRSRDEFYGEQMQKQQDVIDDLNRVLTRTETRYEREVQRAEDMRQRLAVRHSYLQQAYASEFSLSRVLQFWRRAVEEGRLARQAHRLADRSYKRRLMRVSFAALNKESMERRLDRRHYDSKSHFEVTLRDMVTKYESEISVLQSELRESQGAARAECLRRQQLEEDLRRMFLKNMTVMNMEALSLFQDPQSLPPQMAEFGPTVVTDREQVVLLRKEKQQSALREEMKEQQRVLRERQQGFSCGATLPTKAPPAVPSQSRGHGSLNDENSLAPDGSRIIRVSQKATAVVHHERTTRHVTTQSSSHGSTSSRHSSREMRRADDADIPQPRAPLRNMWTG